MQNRSRTHLEVLVATAVAVTLFAAGARGQGTDPDKLVPDDEPAAPAATEATPTEAEPTEPARPPAPRSPTAAEVRGLVEADPRYARPLLRRAARTATDPEVRALGLIALVRVDPGRATARICARALRIDLDARVRRAAAECLGRLPAEASSSQTSTLVAALDDDSLDVQTMAGWALASVGDESSLAPVTARASDDDPRVARLFYDYAQRLRARHGAPVPRLEELLPSGPRAVPRADALIPSTTSLETTAATTWLALYGGMSGWLHGGLFPIAVSSGLENVAVLSALGGAVAGVAAGGAYGFFRAKKLTLAHNVVQLGTLGTLAGYGAGMLSGARPQSGLNMASYSLSGFLAGTGVALAVNEAYPPTPGALALGVATGFGTGVGFGALALSYGATVDGFAGAALFFGGTAGALTTAIAAPYDIGLLPVLGATFGGVALASATGFLLGAVEGAQGFGSEGAFTPGAGWSVVGAYIVGASAGAGLAMLAPDDLDPFLVGGLKLEPPTLTVLPDVVDPRRTVTLASLGGTF